MSHSKDIMSEEERVLQGVNRLPISRMIGYSVGDVGITTMKYIIAAYAMLFFTANIGASAVLVSTLFLIATVIQVLSIPIMGIVVDRTRTRNGKFRPYLLFGSIVLGITTILLFTTPAFNGTVKLVYAYIIYIVISLMHTLVHASYVAMAPALTQHPKERNVFVAVKSITVLLFGGIVTYAISLLLNMLRHKINIQEQVMITSAVIYSIVGFVLIFISFYATKAKTIEPAEKKPTIKELFCVVLYNKPLIVLIIIKFIVMVAFSLKASFQMYYFMYILKNIRLVAQTSLLSMLGMILSAILFPILANRLGKKRVFYIGMIIACIAGTVMYFIDNSSTPIVIGSMMFVSAGTTLANFSLGVMGWDTVEYGQWKTGIRAEGTIMNIPQFFSEIGHVLIGGLAGIILASCGIIPRIQQQSVQTLSCIKNMMTLIPILCFVVTIVIMYFYNLNEQKYIDIITAINSKEAK